MAAYWPLKAKYRLPGRLIRRDKIDPPEGTWVYNAGRFHTHARTNASNPKSKVMTLRPPMRAYWGAVAR